VFYPLNIKAADDSRGTVDPRIPIWLILGPDGTGKDATIKRLGEDVQGENCALVFTNKAHWVRAWCGGTQIAKNIAQSPSGPICCFSGSDILDAFYQLHLRKLGLAAPKLDYECVLVSLGAECDTSHFVTTVQNNDRIDLTYRITRIVYAIDPRDCTRAIVENNAPLIGQADTLLLTGTDSCSSEDIDTARTMLTTINPLAAILSSDSPSLRAKPAWALPLGSFKQTTGQQAANQTGMVQINGPSETAVCFAGNLYNVAGWNSPSEALSIRAMRICIPGELDIAKYMQVVDALVQTIGRGLLRLSAALDVRHAEHQILFEIISGNMLQPAFNARHQRGASDICIIAAGLSVFDTYRALRGCAWETAATRTRFEAAI